MRSESEIRILRTEDNLDGDDRRFAALDLIALPVWIYDFDLRRIRWANRAGLRVWQAASLEALRQRDLGADMSTSVADRLAQYRDDFETHDAVFNEQWTLYPDGRPVPVNVRLSGVRLADGRMALLSEGSPPTAQQPESIRSVEALLHTAVMISLFGMDGAPLYRNPAARRSIRSPDETLAQRIVDLAAHMLLLRELDERGSARRALAVHTVDGERWHEVSARHCHDAVTGQRALLISEVDVTAIKHAEAQAQLMALRDPLTNLPNRSQLFQTFGQLAGSLRDLRQEAALLFIDLDHFKYVNDSFGHAVGDALLIEVGHRLQRTMRDALLVARLGGDEFLILFTSSDLRGELPHVRDRLSRAISAPAAIQGHELRITPSIGVSLYPQDGEDIETLMRNADLAMYAAKERGRNEMAYYDTMMSDTVKARTELENDLRHALDDGSIEVHYQPIVASASGRIVGAEALARWTHPRHGAVPPDIFIPISESAGLIRTLGAHVFRTAARQQAAWQRAGHALRMSVNLSARQLRQPDLLDDLRAALEASGADPRMLQLEMTESMLLGHDRALLEQLRGIEAMGLTLALDDFGTGYSNLGYLQRFPIRTLKIDKSFIQSLDANRPLAELIVSMCRLMRLSSVAEGVETPEQWAWVRSQGIEYCQGFLFAGALTADAFEQRLHATPAATDSA